MSIIDKMSEGYLRAIDAEVEAREQELEDPPDQSAGASIVPRKRKTKPDEVQFFLKSNTLGVLMRLEAIATNNLYSRDENGTRYRQEVNPGVQLAAATSFLDRAMGKPQVSVDLTSGDRPIVIDSALIAQPLIQAEIAPVGSIESTGSTDDIDQVDSMEL